MLSDIEYTSEVGGSGSIDRLTVSYSKEQVGHKPWR
jgi:hypothetical protein